MLIKTWIYIEQTYNELWCRVKDLIGKDFEVRALHDNEYITTKTKSYKDEIKSDFHDEALSSDKTKCLTHSIILIKSIYEIYKSNDPQALLEGCKCKFKKKAVRDLWLKI